MKNFLKTAGIVISTAGVLFTLSAMCWIAEAVDARGKPVRIGGMELRDAEPIQED